MIILKNKSATLILLLFTTCFNSLLKSQGADPYYILKSVNEKAQQVKTLKYDAFMRERFNGKFVDKNSFFKINVSPFRLYVKEKFLGLNVEGLYNEGQNNNQLFISTTGFPWVSTNMDPNGKKVRDNHHHTIFETGFTYFVSVINQLLTNNKDKLIVKYAGDEIKHNNKCAKIEIINNDFKYIKYTVKPGETLTTIAKKLYLNDYMLLELNPDIEYYNDVKPGQVITVPSTYGKKMVLYVDKAEMLPIQIDIYDDKGLYAAYSYMNLVINPVFAWNEFNLTFKDYHFR